MKDETSTARTTSRQSSRLSARLRLPGVFCAHFHFLCFFVSRLGFSNADASRLLPTVITDAAWAPSNGSREARHSATDASPRHSPVRANTPPWCSQASTRPSLFSNQPGANLSLASLSRVNGGTTACGKDPLPLGGLDRLRSDGGDRLRQVCFLPIVTRGTCTVTLARSGMCRCHGSPRAAGRTLSALTNSRRTFFSTQGRRRAAERPRESLVLSSFLAPPHSDSERVGDAAEAGTEISEPVESLDTEPDASEPCLSGVELSGTEENPSMTEEERVESVGSPPVSPAGEVSSQAEGRRLLHFRLRVRNLEKMLRFYTEVLGMHVLGYGFTPAAQKDSAAASTSPVTQEQTVGRHKPADREAGHSDDAGAAATDAASAKSSLRQSPPRPDDSEGTGGEAQADSGESSLTGNTAKFSDACLSKESKIVDPNAATLDIRDEDVQRETVEDLIAQHRRETSLHPPHVSIGKQEGGKGATTTAALRRAAEAAENAGPVTVVLLGYPPSESDASSASCDLDTLKIELVHVPLVADLLERLDSQVQSEDETEANKFLHILKQHMMGLSKDLPTINRAREFERRRNRHDRGFHGFLGVTVCLPSLDDITHETVEARGGRLFQLPAQRKLVPSMIPDEHARKDIWLRCAYLLDPEGNGIELVEAREDSSVGLDPAAVMREHQHLQSWEAYMHDQERDVRIQEVKRQIHLLSERIAKQERSHPAGTYRVPRKGDEDLGRVGTGAADTDAAAATEDASERQRGAEAGTQEDSDRGTNSGTAKGEDNSLEGEEEALRKALNIKSVGAPKTPQEQLEILQDALEAMQAQEATRPRQPFVQLPPSRGPFLQKVRAYTSRILFADQFYCKQLKMKAVRYKSHLFERLYPWSRFAGVSKTFGCPMALDAAIQRAAESPAADQAADAGIEEFASMEKFAQGGDSMSLPAEWESESSTEPAKAARKVYATEVAERKVPQLELIYAFDEDLIRIHPCFGYLAVGVDDVSSAVATLQANARMRKQRNKRKNDEDDDGDDEDDDEATTEACRTSTGGDCSTTAPSSQGETVSGEQVEATATAIRNKLKAAGFSLDRAMVEDRDGYPILLVSNEYAQRYYADLHENLRRHQEVLQKGTNGRE
ncbi:glyoxalase family protein [Besnoitia besnoiti]|uniref:Glyoxalase family protein n=1 Tax=Besnoitia besnoiti TaxID=94643 RepID=A0A2A9ML16_BESBE|nr:glyoxalase family protein [Besnoitia besnoiti]PFH36327.1 glyoxalase family protein [Besnoitia besnoiti]